MEKPHDRHRLGRLMYFVDHNVISDAHLTVTQCLEIRVSARFKYHGVPFQSIVTGFDLIQERSGGRGVFKKANERCNLQYRSNPFGPVLSL